MGVALKIQLFGVLGGFALACSVPALAATALVEISGGGGNYAYAFGSNGRAELAQLLPEGAASG